MRQCQERGGPPGELADATFSTSDLYQDPKCVLCPKELRDNSVLLPNKSSKAKKPPLDFDLLSAIKPTEGLRWAHILCPAWVPEVVYTNPYKLKTVENIMSLGEEHWSSVSLDCAI